MPTNIPTSLIHRADRLPRLFEIDAIKLPIADKIAYLLCDADEIVRRREIFADITANPELREVYGKLAEMLGELSDFFVKYGSPDTNEEIIYSFVEISKFIEVVDYIATTMHAQVESEKIKASEAVNFIAACVEFTRSQLYAEVKNVVAKLDRDLRDIKSVTLGVNIDAQFRVAEVGLVSFNSHPYVSGGIIETLFRDKIPPSEYKCIATLGVHEVRDSFHKRITVVNREFFTAINDAFRTSLKKFRCEIIDAIKPEITAILGLKDDVDFITDMAKYIHSIQKQGGKLTFPENGDVTEITGLYDPTLLDKMPFDEIVRNDVKMDGNLHGFVLTGPNSGGKSVYLNSIGVAQLMYQLGLPIPAASATMQPFDSIACMYVRDVTKSNNGRLATEAERLKRCLLELDGRALLLLDETFSSTSAFDGVYLAESLIKYFLAHDCYFVYVTHFHELGGRISELNSNGEVTRMLSAQNINGKRTYKILPTDSLSGSEQSLAKDIAIENGLEFLFDKLKNTRYLKESIG